LRGVELPRFKDLHSTALRICWRSKWGSEI